MKKLSVAMPVILGAALSLAACNKPDAANETAVNEQVANDEGPIDANAAGDNAVAPVDGPLNDAAANAAAPSSGNAQ